MKFPYWIDVYGDQSYRGKCPKETVEQVTFFNKIRREHPVTWGILALHTRNEGKRTIHKAVRYKAEGMSKGSPDIMIPGSPTFVCELKRQDHTKSQWEDGQREYLYAAFCSGAFTCVALGHEAAYKAFKEWSNEGLKWV